MPHRSKRARIAEEARLLFTLIDAVAHDGRLPSPELRRAWTNIQDKAARLSYEETAEDLFELMVALEAAGALHKTWMLGRWHAALKRIDGSRTGR